MQVAGPDKRNGADTLTWISVTNRDNAFQKSRHFLISNEVIATRSHQNLLEDAYSKSRFQCIYYKYQDVGPTARRRKHSIRV